MDPLAEGLERAAERWRARGLASPAAMVVSGSGLAVDLGAAEAETPLAEWLPFAPHAVAGHPQRLAVLRPRPDCPVLYQQGRLHAYQGYDPHQVVFAIRLAALLGARTLLMTNAAGGLGPRRPGELVLIRDHLNLTALNPLRGELPPAWGPRFPDLTDAYDPELRRAARAAARRQGLELAEGVYAAVPGPSYETPAEIVMIERLGADLVGMSTVLEVIAARHLGMRCLCLSLVTNRAAGVGAAPLDHQDVLAAGQAAAGPVRALLGALLADPAAVPGLPAAAAGAPSGAG